MSRNNKHRKANNQEKLLQKIHVDIPVNYELLAKEILKQQEILTKAESDDKIKSEEQQIKENNENILSETMSGLASVFFWVVGIVLFLLGLIFLDIFIIFIIDILKTWGILGLGERGLKIAMCVIILLVDVILVGGGIVMVRSANEIEKEKDRNYIVSVFSAITCFIALIISGITLVITITH